VLMVKGSAVASVVSVLDLMGETRIALSRSFDMQAYLYAAVLYLIIVETLRRVWERLETRLTRHLTHDGTGGGTGGGTRGGSRVRGASARAPARSRPPDNPARTG